MGRGRQRTDRASGRVRVGAGLWPGLGGHLRLQKGRHGCWKFLGDAISFFFHFLSGNLARGEEHSAGQEVAQEGAPQGTHVEQGGWLGAVALPWDLWAMSAKPGLPY